MFGAVRNKPLVSQNLPVVSRTQKTRIAQVTQEILETYENLGNPMASALLEFSQLEKLRGTFIGAPANGDTEATGIYKRMVKLKTHAYPTVHASFKQHGTVTGRFSAADPNLQQLPRGSTIRSLFVAEPGYTLIVADYDQIELRVAGFLSGDPSMLYVFTSGEDIHRRAAAVMFQIAPEKVTDAQRQVGKTQNFAVLYGAGEEKIAFVAQCSIPRAKSLIKNYYAEFEALEPWKNKLLREARRAGSTLEFGHKPPHVLIPPFGRKRRLPLLYAEQLQLLPRGNYGATRRAERQAVNAKVQGMASSITKLAMRDLHTQLRPFDAHMLAQVHDEIVVMTNEDDLTEVLPMVERVMSGVLHPDEGTPILGEVPLVVSAAYGHTWAEAKG